jgi:uncharacterized membrane protein YhaH (DUF805 family)
MKKYIFPIATLIVVIIHWSTWIYVFYKNGKQQIKAQSEYFAYTGLNMETSYYFSFFILALLFASLGYTIRKLKARVPQIILTLLLGFFILLTLWSMM